MSNDQIINSWKDEDESETRKVTEPALASPAGIQELSDEILEKIEGGLGNLSCPLNTC